jgi:hypothetical protein
VEVGEQGIGAVEIVAGEDEEAGFAVEGVDGAVFVGGGFEEAERGGADGDEAVARGAGGVDAGGGLGGDVAAFGVDLVLVDVVVAERQEGAGADVQGDGFALDVVGGEAREEVGGEVEAGGGGGDGALVLGEDGLVVGGVGGGGALGAGDVGGQGEGAGLVQGVGEGLGFEVEAERDAAAVVEGFDGGGEGGAVVEGEEVTGVEAF